MSAQPRPQSRDWDGKTYDRVSTPQQEMAGPVLDRLPLRGDERVLDAGCGSGRVTLMLLDRLPDGHAVAVDAAPSMVEQAQELLPPGRTTVFEASLMDVVLDEPVDAVFSNAVFHWVPDHPLMFRRLFEALKPGGRLVAQCGGEGNVAGFHANARAVAADPPYAEHLDGWPGPWNFAGPGVTKQRLEAAGFGDVETWLEPWPVQPPEPLAYVEAVCLGPFLQRLPEELRREYAEAVAARYGGEMELDYVRLNINARRPE